MFEAPLATPFYKDHVLYHVVHRAGIPSVRAWRFNGWKPESFSWKTGCYIHAGLSSTGPLSLKGPDAERFLESLCINSFKKFSVGAMKHAVMCDEHGLIAAHGILARKSYASEFGRHRRPRAAQTRRLNLTDLPP